MITFSKYHFGFLKNKGIKTVGICLITLLSGILTSSCTRLNINVSNPMFLPALTRIGVGPFANHTNTPLANRQVESMLVGLLQAKGFRNIKHYQHTKSCAKLLYCPDETLTNEQILRWARLYRLNYVFTGAANEWRYKVGLDGEPVAGASLILLNVHSGHTVWTAVGSAIGGSRSGLDEVGQKLLNCLLADIKPIYYK